MVKIRQGFVSNSSSSSFVIVLSKLPSNKKEETKNVILKHCTPTTIEELDNLIETGWVDTLYNLVEYDEGDDEMHVWVRRDECMCNDELDDILYASHRNKVEPKYDKHY